MTTPRDPAAAGPENHDVVPGPSSRLAASAHSFPRCPGGPIESLASPPVATGSIAVVAPPTSPPASHASISQPYAAWPCALAARAAIVRSIDEDLQSTVAETDRVARSMFDQLDAIHRGVTSLATTAHANAHASDPLAAPRRALLAAHDDVLDALRAQHTAAADDRHAVAALVGDELRTSERALDAIEHGGAAQPPIAQARATVAASFERLQDEITSRWAAFESRAAAGRATVERLAEQVRTFAGAAERVQATHATLLAELARCAESLHPPTRDGMALLQFQDVACKRIEHCVRLVQTLEQQVAGLATAIATGAIDAAPIELELPARDSSDPRPPIELFHDR